MVHLGSLNGLQVTQVANYYGKRTVCYGKSAILIGKSSINMYKSPFSIVLLNYQKVIAIILVVHVAYGMILRIPSDLQVYQLPSGPQKGDIFDDQG